ncbi:unnamed protein product, partial [Heterosigma akashiwo]
PAEEPTNEEEEPAEEPAEEEEAPAEEPVKEEEAPTDAPAEDDESKKRARDDEGEEDAPAKISKPDEAATDKSKGTPADFVPKAEAFCGGLAKEVTEDDLKELFKEIAEVEEVRLVTDRHTKESKGFAFVRFPSVPTRDAAVEKFDKHELKGRAMAVSPASQNITVYVGRIDRGWDPEKAERLIKENFEGVVTFELMTDGAPEGESNRGFGFITFDLHANALKATKRGRDGVTIEGCALRMDWAEARQKADEEAEKNNTSVYVTKLDEGVTEEQMKEAFAPFGEVKKVTLSNQMPGGKRKDYAFITFEKREDALKAAEEMNGKSLEAFPDKPMTSNMARIQRVRKERPAFASAA